MGNKTADRWRPVPPSMQAPEPIPAAQPLTPAEHAAKLARTYELAADLGGIAREILAKAGRADRAAARRDIDLLAEASDDLADLAGRYAAKYLEMMTVRARPLPAEPLAGSLADGRMWV